MILPSANLSAAQISDMNSFTSSGGIVVLVAEATGYYTAGVGYLNNAAAGLGLSSVFTAGSLDAGCGQTATRLVTTPVLTATMSSLTYAYGSSVSTRGSGTSLYSRAGNVFVAREGHTLLVSEGGIFYASCAGTSGNSAFSAAIYNWSCDYDEDLVRNVDCGGTDQDDTDAAIGSSRTWYADSDGDGYGNASSSTTATNQPSGYVSDSTDCNDTNAGINPGATETCDSANTDEDCDGNADDADGSATGQSTWYVDGDSDSYGGNSSLSGCDQPSGYTNNPSDCDDGNNQIYPGATEYCNGADDNCDGTVDENSSANADIWYQDSDGDGYGNGSVSILSCTQPIGYVADVSDCDDGDADNNPGATEVCDGDDDNCDGTIDESSAADAGTWYADTDGDSYGDASSTQRACSQPSGYVSLSSDCNDGVNTIYPGATEFCDGTDNNCDGSIDENSATNAATWYADGDGDGYGNAASSQQSCYQPSGYVAGSSDCDDNDTNANPGATEYCDGDDDNCNGVVDESSSVDALSWYADTDGDGFGDAGSLQVDCYQPAGFVSQSSDCNDADADANPSATEYCDGDDDNCNGVVDEDSAADALTWYADSDNDGFGDPVSPTVTCYQPSGSVSDNTDCDDAAAASYPGNVEVCDGADNNCDGQVDENSAADAIIWYADADSDGFGDQLTTATSCAAPASYIAIAADCNDSDAAISPSATEICDNVDNDCDGDTDDADSSLVGASTWYYDADADSVGDTGTSVVSCNAPADFVAVPGDCDDEDATVSPLLPELCDPNDVDENCNGLADDADSGVDSSGFSTWYSDADGDGYGDDNRSVLLCNAPAGTVLEGGDCDDNNMAFNPAATETCDDPTDYNCDGSVGYADADQDGWAACEECDDATSAINPDATERCNGLDDNCDTVVDLDAVDAPTWYTDADKDGQGNAEEPVVACSAPEGTVGDSQDCDDDDASIYVGATEIAGDAIDQDCDGKDEEAEEDSTPDSEDSIPVVDSGDSNTDSVKEDDPGCGCSSNSSGSLGIAGLGLLGVLGARRRRS